MFCRKDHITRELLSQRRWPDKWGFLANEYRQVKISPAHTLKAGNALSFNQLVTNRISDKISTEYKGKHSAITGTTLIKLMPV